MKLNNNDYKVELTNIYSGPLDLLLYLVKKEEIAIHEIAISRITEQYLHYIEVLQMLDVNIASDFLLMAATLMHIKSHSLLPANEEMECDDEDDPKFELIRQLLEYKRYKDLASQLSEKRLETAKKAPRPKIDIPIDEKDDDLILELNDVTVWDLVNKFSDMIKQTLLNEPTLIKDDNKPISAYMDDLMVRIDDVPFVYFHNLFEGANNRTAAISFFLALLELIRLNRLKIQQETAFDNIRISKYLTETI